MNDTAANTEPRNTNAHIKDEIIALGQIYGLDKEILQSTIDRLNFDRYAEYALGQDSFEIVSGGIGQSAALVELARGLEVTDSIISRFDRCAARFPGRMAWLKLGFGPEKSQPTLYLNLMEPWSSVLAFLETLPEAATALDAFRAHLGRSSICALLAFSMDKASASPVVKTYHAYDRRKGSAPMPLLVSHRLANGVVREEPRYYAPLPWEELPSVGDGLAPIAASATRALGGRAYPVVKGYHVTAGEHADLKLYIFRHDVRVGAWQPRRDSLYTSEGNVLLGRGYYQEAIVAYGNAIDLNASDFAAFNNRALCFALLGNREMALEDAEAAKGLEPEMRFRLANEVYDFIERIADLSRRMENDGTAEHRNLRGIMLFSKGLFALAAKDFEVAVRLKPDFAEGYNNLGGAYLNLGRYAESFESCGKAISLDESTDTTNYLLALKSLKQAETAGIER